MGFLQIDRKIVKLDRSRWVLQEAMLNRLPKALSNGPLSPTFIEFPIKMGMLSLRRFLRQQGGQETDAIGQLDRLS